MGSKGGVKNAVTGLNMGISPGSCKGLENEGSESFSALHVGYTQNKGRSIIAGGARGVLTKKGVTPD